MESGRQAISRGAWAEARAYFEVAFVADESPESLEMLGLAAFWMEDADATIAAREGAYRLYRARGDLAGAARSAVTLADDYFTFRNQRQVANGWLMRARRLLAGRELSPEHGMLACEAGFIALMGSHDAVNAGAYGTEAVACGRALGVVDIEMFGLALEGLAMVSRGQIAPGMARLDEATAAATSGEVADPTVAGAICCTLIFACEWVRDYPRAVEWCERVKAYCEQWQISSLLGVCRAHYAAVLIWRGAWGEAEEQLAASSVVLGTVRPALEAEATVRLGELRRRQGRLREAATLFEQAASHPHALLGHSSIALEQGASADAAEWAERFLRRLPAGARVERAAGLEVLLRAHLALADRAAAGEVAAELRAIAMDIGTEPLLAVAAVVDGLLASADGDLTTARQKFEDARYLFDHAGAPFEAATLRLDLAAVLRAAGRSPEARREVARAETTFQSLGRITVDAAIISADPQAAGHSDHLTRREREVLVLLSSGLSNQEIAAVLVISVRTVERHISTVYEKLGAGGKSARAAASAYAIRKGLA